MNRRAALGTIGGSAVALASGLAGCSVLGEQNDQSEPFTFCHLSLFNEDHRSHRLQVRIQADGDTIHEEAYELSSASGNVVADRELDPREWFDGTTRQLTLWGRVGDQTPVGPTTLTASEVEESTTITYLINEDETLDIQYLAAGERAGTSGCSSGSENTTTSG